jgi:hypothetical protein
LQGISHICGIQSLFFCIIPLLIASSHYLAPYSMTTALSLLLALPSQQLFTIDIEPFGCISALHVRKLIRGVVQTSNEAALSATTIPERNNMGRIKSSNPINVFQFEFNNYQDRKAKIYQVHSVQFHLSTPRCLMNSLCNHLLESIANDDHGSPYWFTSVKLLLHKHLSPKTLN